MKLFFLHLPGKTRKTGEHAMVTVYKRPYNTSEGGEFLDDAIRTTDQPLSNNGVHTNTGQRDSRL